MGLINRSHKKSPFKSEQAFKATRTGLEPATSGSTVRGSNQLSYRALQGKDPDAGLPLLERGLYRPDWGSQVELGAIARGSQASFGWFVRDGSIVRG